MSVEDYHYMPFRGVQINTSEIAAMRQALYDAKLALEGGDLKQAKLHILDALDRSQKWPGANEGK